MAKLRNIELSKKNGFNNNFLKEIELFRAVAALLVLYFHANMVFPKYVERLESDYNSLLTFFFEGHTGVSLFFVISGFLLSIKWVVGREVSTKQFYINRALRIIPLYYVALLFYFYVTKTPENLSFNTIMPYFLFFQNTLIEKADLGGAAGVFWSLSPEIHFYIMLPFLMVYFRKSRALFYNLIIISLVIKIFMPSLINSIFGRMDQFLVGVFAADIYFNKLKDLKLKQVLPWGVFFLGIVSLLLFLHRLSGYGGYTAIGLNWYFWTFFHTGEALLWALIIVSFLLISSNIKRFLLNRIFMGIGTISYSIYIWHYFVIIALKKTQNRLLESWEWLFTGHANIDYLIYTTLIILPVVLLISIISYFYIEKPFLLFKSNVNNEKK
ncbi:acyltransferase family protein [Paenibacillus senegalimassiliensis]|uniref:acyltransferase family protein n=1 Tax=Paenibacillus senegalimassiliensis TaxID=1737426 RepID=UPI00073F6ACB|nr:acyltransferase [Paenibacillus senegalimassiliensis]